MANDTVTLGKELVQEIFKLAGLEVPAEISDENFLSAVFALKNCNITKKVDAVAFDATASNNILVIDDIGVVTYQLKVLFKNLGYNVHIARDIFSGLNTFVKSNYDFVIMDLFVSTEQEGFTLLNETKKLIAKNNLNTKIIVITADNKTENRVKCINGGADVFLKKETGWQDKLVEIVENIQNNQSYEEDEES